MVYFGERVYKINKIEEAVTAVAAVMPLRLGETGAFTLVL